MPRSPQGSGMYHEVSPQHSRYYARILVDDATKTLREFLIAHGLARDYPEPKFKQRANDLFSQVQKMKFELIELPPSFPPVEQQRIDSLIRRIQNELEGHPAFYIPSSGNTANNPSLPAFPIQRAPPVIPRVHHSSQSISQSPPSLIAFSDNS